MTYSSCPLVTRAGWACQGYHPAASSPCATGRAVTALASAQAVKGLAAAEPGTEFELPLVLPLTLLVAGNGDIVVAVADPDTDTVAGIIPVTVEVVVAR